MKKGFINILLYLIFPSVFIMLFYRFLNNKIAYFFINVIPYILLTIYFVMKYKKNFINDYKKINKKNILTMLIIWIIGFILMMFSNYIINYIVFDNGIAVNEQNNRALLLNYKLTYSLIIGLFIPILEEIAFRVEFKKNLQNKYTFLIVSSLLFSLLHLLGATKLIELIYIIPYFILGLSFTFIYQKTDCLYLNILAHIIHNLVCIVIILFF